MSALRDLHDTSQVIHRSWAQTAYLANSQAMMKRQGWWRSVMHISTGEKVEEPNIYRVKDVIFQFMEIQCLVVAL